MDYYKEYHNTWGLGDVKYEVGDIVTRDGTDEHKILMIDYPYGMLRVVCVKEPFVEKGENPWTRVGEIEGNLIRRYTLVRKKDSNNE